MSRVPEESVFQRLCGLCVSAANVKRRVSEETLRYLFLPERLARPGLFDAQARACIFIGIGSHDLPEVDAVEISAGIEFLAHRLRQRLGRQIVTVQRPALVVNDTLLDNG